MLNLSIRHAKLNELPRVKYITKLSYKIPYKTNTLVTKSHEPKNIQESFLNKEFFIIVAILENKIVGAVRYKLNEKNELYFYKLAVLKTHRSRGIGSKLVNEIEKVAEKKGCAKVLLDCAREKKLPDYYKKLGYEINLVKKHLDHHDVYMSKRIKIKNSK
ncbi:MAG: GCN5-related N-acetyltransferase [Candidatus Uhrbacteria bacterium GW2011_GWD2_41_121]|uniref:GCN5-related N-acetyltransferase n=1 Tax=Candidatus Uhrbacteria bacterium GW2011_GWC1_41_20 TaxID=1618983 RepID=A0A0G0VDR2_9BACT|nr:MAG: GCN5-related N-acetyltransferase [Candidatus Uhrbacteria bacterium GW2011_GWE1_39_46]KKR63872.1 MAG: GCN5-related N-acetyltransferase [Candidatus Uhrbacteria bacterium GW2011_GWC2_40_450]KKR89543.1 MAG: GCN5-related N-acetyltransferase [Candidatus Uhrbacteria bacterium GW2011_GWE2_41_1153]KKR90056.1 MAG: GCN5-related N-acetyltransferase [Candidatus Uhrbacteria bacterium GW2011_GWD2_41_121]KKR96016.1 MAG: GCN5-related N-acetyltransferase [Candidatus Uhrbacteria bacterium GW2011_GWD1_41_1